MADATQVPSPAPFGATALTIEQLFLRGRFAPAKVQRDFKWGVEQASALLSDLVRQALPTRTERGELTIDAEADDDGDEAADAELNEAPSTTHGKAFIGSMIVTANDAGDHEVFDGQQRLTTLTILTCQLRDQILAPALKARLHALVESRASEFRVQLSRREKALLNEIQKPGEALRVRRSAPESAVGSNIRAINREYRTSLGQWTEAEREAFAEFFLERTWVVLIGVDSPPLARLMFVTSNMRGLPLDRVELFKGQLMDLAADDSVADNVAMRWDKIRQNLGRPRPVGARVIDLEGFLVAYDLMVRRQPQDADCLQQLVELIGERFKGPAFVDWFGRFEAAAMACWALNNIFGGDYAEPFEVDIWRLSLVDWPEWRALALLWFMDYWRTVQSPNPSARTIALFKKRIAALPARCISMTLAGFDPNDRCTIIGKAIGQAQSGKNPLKMALRMGTGQAERIREVLRMPMAPDIARQLMRWHESHLWTSRPPTDIARATLEHVLPLRSSRRPGWVASIPDPEKRAISAELPGNFALATAEMNERLADNELADKQKVIEPTKGTSEFATLWEVCGHASWNENDIRQRTESLASVIEQRLDLN